MEIVTDRNNQTQTEIDSDPRGKGNEETGMRLLIGSK